MTDTLTSLSDTLAAAVERTAPLVVAVHGRPRLASSGVLWKPGVIVTADHTLKRDEEITVTLPDGRSALATLAGRDPGTDLAVLKVDGFDTTPPQLAPAETLKSGNLVLAVARSEETGVNATMGVISAVAGPWNTWRGGRLDHYIRLDLTLYPGASGGAVVDAAGRLAGIATSALSRTAGVAIPVATIERVAAELLTRGRIARGYLGVGLQPVALPDHLVTKLNLAAKTGLIVLTAEPGAPAERAGILIGDVLLTLDGKPLADIHGLQAALGTDYVGKTVQAQILRGGELAETSITVGERPRRQ
jgi:S1-C subfamily serine protease